MFRAKLLRNESFELALQDSDVGVTPYRSLAVLKFSRPNALKDEIPVYTVVPACLRANPRTGGHRHFAAGHGKSS